MEGVVGVPPGSRDHLGVAVLQPTLEVAIGANLILLDGLVDGFFLVFLGHRAGGHSTEGGGV